MSVWTAYVWLARFVIRRNLKPHLILAHVHDALSFHHDHRPMIDRAIRQNRETTARPGAGDLDPASKGRGRLSRRRG